MSNIKIFSLFLLFILIYTEVIYTQRFNWQALPNAPVAGRYDDMHFITPNLGWVVNSSGQIYKTTDGGNTWTKQFQCSLPYK